MLNFAVAIVIMQASILIGYADFVASASWSVVIMSTAQDPKGFVLINARPNGKKGQIIAIGRAGIGNGVVLIGQIKKTKLESAIVTSAKVVA